MAQGKRNNPIIQPTEQDAWWAAGFVDGEGCITIRQTPGSKTHSTWNPSFYASITVSQVDIRPLVYLRDRWGGSLRALKVRKENERPAWEWTVVGELAWLFLDQIGGLLKVKGESAQNALLLRGVNRRRGSTGHGRSLTEDEVAQRRALRERALELNRRGA